jgi:hypothetical protein
MALNGSLSTMPLPDLLQWVAAARRAGTLTVESGRVTKRIAFMNGRVIGCSTDDPPALLGQFLLSRGKIEREHLREALERQEQTGQSIGEILIAMQVLTPEALSQTLSAKAEDVIFGLFDWEDAVFRFEPEVEADRYQIRVDLDVQEILLRGLERQDQMKRFRTVFPDDGVVLSKTAKQPPDEVMQSKMARRIFESVNGERTLAETILHAHASEFLVTKFLFQLHKMGNVEVTDHRPVTSSQAGADDPVHEIEADNGLSLDHAAAAAAAAMPVEPATEPAAEDAGLTIDEHFLAAASGDAPLPVAADEMIAAATAATPDHEPSPVAGPAAPATSEPVEETHVDLATEIAVGMSLMERGENEAALEVLNASYRAHPGDTSLRHLVAKAEQAIEHSHSAELSPEKVPHLLKSAEELAGERLSTEAAFLPSLIDGKTDIKSILWLAPMRTVDVMRALKQMIDRGLVELRDPAGEQARSA